MSAGQRVAVGATKTAAYTVDLAIDHIVRVDTNTTGAFTVTLPAGHVAGDVVVIKDVVGNCGVDNCTIDANGSETIDGVATFVMTVNYQSVALVSDGTNWLVY